MWMIVAMFICMAVGVVGYAVYGSGRSHDQPAFAEENEGRSFRYMPDKR